MATKRDKDEYDDKIVQFHFLPSSVTTQLTIIKLPTYFALVTLMLNVVCDNLNSIHVSELRNTVY